MGDDLPPLPRVDLGVLFKVRYDVRANASPYAGVALDAESLDGLSKNVVSSLKALGVRTTYDAVADTLEPHAGSVLDPKLTDRIAWRLAGNLATLRKGRPVPAWSGLQGYEWMPLQVVSCHRRSRFGKGRTRHGVSYSLQVLAGSYCPNRLTKWWSVEQYSFLAKEAFGFAQFSGKPSSFQNHRQLVGLRFFGFFDPELSRGSVPSFREVKVSSSMAAYNRVILRRRFRTDPCPFGYDHECHQCTVGYAGKDGDGACLAAVHPLTYSEGYCKACDRPDALFDPHLSKKVCFACFEANETTRQV